MQKIRTIRREGLYAGQIVRHRCGDTTHNVQRKDRVYQRRVPMASENREERKQKRATTPMSSECEAGAFRLA